MMVDRDTYIPIVTLMGWNQLVMVNNLPLRVNSFNMGSKQTANAPDYVTGAADRGAWTKGPVITEGSIDFPFTFDAPGTFSGLEMFRFGADLAANPATDFTVSSSVHGSFSGCKVNTTKLSCDAEGEIKVSADIWGVMDTENLSGQNNQQPAEYNQITDSMGGKPTGSTDGYGRLGIVQIPMWDNVSVQGAPTGMYVKGFELNIDNQLKRIYTMGKDGNASALGLNANGIAAGQRKVTGSIKWQSNKDGNIKAIIGSGIQELIITIGSTVFTLKYAVWNAEPPSVSAADVVMCNSSFTALGTGNGFDALVIS